MSSFRFFGNSILTFLTKIASGYWKTMDPQNGYTAITNHALSTVGIENMYEYYGYCNDLLVKLNAKGLRVADVAMPAIYGEETSTISYPTYIRKVSKMLLENFLWRLKVKYLVLDFHPLAFLPHRRGNNGGWNARRTVVDLRLRGSRWIAVRQWLVEHARGADRQPVSAVCDAVRYAGQRGSGGPDL